MSRTPDETLRLRVRLGLVAVGIALVGGTVGFHFIEGWSWLASLYMTVITISTVGFREVEDLSAAGKVFTIVLIMGGIGSVAVLGSNLIEWMIERQVNPAGWRRKMARKIDAVNGHIIVCGYGRMGRYVVNALQQGKTPFVVLEQDAAACQALEEKGLLVVQGDASEEPSLLAAGVERASALVAALSSDAENLYLTLTAHGMNPRLRIIVRAEESVSHGKFLRAGAAKVVSPYVIGADHIVQLLLRPSVVDFIDLVTQQGDLALSVDQTELNETSPLCGKSLADSRARQSLGRMILAIRKKNGPVVFDPPPETVLRPGDVVITVGHERDVPSAAETRL